MYTSYLIHFFVVHSLKKQFSYLWLTLFNLIILYDKNNQNSWHNWAIHQKYHHHYYYCYQCQYIHFVIWSKWNVCSNLLKFIKMPANNTKILISIIMKWRACKINLFSNELNARFYRVKVIGFHSFNTPFTISCTHIVYVWIKLNFDGLMNSKKKFC